MENPKLMTKGNLETNLEILMRIAGIQVPNLLTLNELIPAWNRKLCGL